MASEVLFDTSGFFALMDERDPAHRKAAGWTQAQRQRVRPVSTEWIVGETCTLLVARSIPTGLRPLGQGCEERAALGKWDRITTPTGLRHC